MNEVLIRMKIPRCCAECRFFSWSRGIGQHCAVDDGITFHATLDGFDVGYERNEYCPLIEVPPHGRLVDVDAMEKMMSDTVQGDIRQYPYSDTQWKLAFKWIDHQPTIIPASGGNEGEEHTMDEFMYGQEGNPNDGSM